MGVLKSDSPAGSASRFSSEDASTSPSNSEISPKHAALLETEVESLNKLIVSVSDEAARIALRQNWRKLVKGNDKDHSFLIRAILKYSNERVFVRLVEAYGEQLIKAANDDFLDLAMTARLKTISAKDLVVMLAKAERLGYEEQDIVDEEVEDGVPLEKRLSEDARQEVNGVIRPKPNEDTVMTDRTDALIEEQNRNAQVTAMAAMAAQAAQVVVPRPVELPNRPASNNTASRRFVCGDCNATFAQSGGLQYHVDRKVCHRPPPQSKYFCKFCSKGFTTPGGKLYHEQNKVCQNHDTAKATAHTPHLQGGGVLIATPRQLPPPLASNRPIPIQSYHTPPSHASSSYNSPTYESGPTKLAPRMSPNYPEFQNHNLPPVQTPVRPSPVDEQALAESPILDAAAKADLDRRIAAEVARFEQKCRDIPDTLTAAEREEEINKQKRGHATRKSQIRKKFGIQVRTSKLRPANFARIPGGETSPRLEPISRIHAFRAPPVAMTPTFALNAPGPNDPSQLECGRLAPPIQGPDPKRRRLSDSSKDPSRPASSGSQYRAEPHSVPGGFQRRASIAGDETVKPLTRSEEDDFKNSEVLVVVEAPKEITAQADKKKVPVSVAQKKWETLQPSKPVVTLPRPASMLNSPTSPLNVQDRGAATAHKANDAVVVLDDSDSDSDPDEDIPARMPAGRSRLSSNSVSLSSTSPGPTMPRNPPFATRMGKRTGSGQFPGRLGGSGSKLRSPVEV